MTAQTARWDLYLWKTMAFLVGLGFFAYTINKFGGMGQVWVQLQIVKWGYLLVILNSGLWMLGYTTAWKLYFTDDHHLISYLSLLRIKICGEAINFLTPMGFVLGDSIRVMLLNRYFGPEARLRSVVVDRATHSLAAQFFCLNGLVFIFSQKVDFPVWLFAGMLLIYVVIFTAMLTLSLSMLGGRGLGFFEPLFHWAQIHHYFPKIHARIETLREDMEYFADKPKRPFVVAFLYHLLGRYLGAVEVLIISYYFNGEWLFGFAMILTAMTSFFSLVFGFIPGALGVLETLYARFFELYGFRPEYGLTVQIIRRFRVAFWVLVGVLILDFEELRQVIREHRRISG